MAKFTTGACRLSYAHIFQPHEDLNGNLKYSASLIIPKADDAQVQRFKAEFDRMVKDPDVRRVLGKGENYRLPLRDGDLERPNDSAYAKSWFINAKSNPDHKPLVVDKERQEIVDPNEVYSGCWVQAVLSFYPYNKGGNRGIGVSLAAIRKLKDGKPLSGTVVTDNDFDDSLVGTGMEDFF